MTTTAPTTTTTPYGIAKGENCVDMIFIADSSLKYYHQNELDFVLKDFNGRFLETLEYYSRSKLLIASDTEAPDMIDLENNVDLWFPVERFKEEFEENSYLRNALNNAGGNFYYKI